MIKPTIVIGFMLFAIFFGAGNLIFPVNLGWESGSYFWPAIIGFLITGVGMPLLGIIAGSFHPDGFPSVMDKKIHPTFSLIFMVVIYLTIGPLFAIPRTATTSYEMGLAPFFANTNDLSLFIFSLLYFTLTVYFSLKPSRMVESVGKYLTPLLLLFISLLCLLAFFRLTIPVTEIRISGNPLTNGFIFGYQTMDTIASIAFAIIVLSSVKAIGITQQTGLFKYCCYSALLAGGCLAIVYLSLGWMGNNYPIDNTTLQHLQHNNQHIGAYLLVVIASSIFGNLGQLIISVIVLLACLTTAIGLTVAVSGYFFAKFPVIKYQHYVWLFCLISLVLSNQGLANVIKGSIPVLQILYPITIVLIGLVFLDQLFNLANLVFQLTIGITSLISMLSVLAKYFELGWAQQITHLLPLQNVDLGWVVPAIVTLVLSYLFSLVAKTTNTVIE